MEVQPIGSANKRNKDKGKERRQHRMLEGCNMDERDKIEGQSREDGENSRRSQITLLTNMYEARPEGGGEGWQALGITTMVDGPLRQLFDIAKREMPELTEDIDVFRSHLFAGMDEMRKRIDARRVEKNL